MTIDTLSPTLDTPPAGALSSPAAQRNVEPILHALDSVVPETGKALEIASGTGEHVVRMADRFPALSWQPSDMDPTRIASIDAYVAAAGLPNLRPAIRIDATRHGWSAIHGGNDLIVVVNLLHLISADEADMVIEQAAKALNRGGRLAVYGPFRRNGKLTSDGDIRFDAELKTRDPLIGYKDDVEMTKMLHANWLELEKVVEMPANNLMFVAHRAN
ncbi:DUF938 domain-containing protein [Pseudooceanicola nanhaiensis]|uniref:DUF938 domain-containing protein n=1 Tax=Pseudooceanicola nanhaiensis TaxID=375761 RepID=UPI001CD61EDB|nr:DUF938 domain-containing protein [Pseudooceanicola nanhaiensis]MCA0920629.1 class I SAM-dependent methyltransferase [Pseudooceanicola nanhaiensis]